jgi:hypothetical protein
MAAEDFLDRQTTLINLLLLLRNIRRADPPSCREGSSNLTPLLVVRLIPSLSCAIKSFLVNNARYSFNCAYERKARYIILVLMAPTSAASKMRVASSVLLWCVVFLNL